MSGISCIQRKRYDGGGFIQVTNIFRERMKVVTVKVKTRSSLTIFFYDS